MGLNSKANITNNFQINVLPHPFPLQTQLSMHYLLETHAFCPALARAYH
jgi:hypothetical protein